MPSKMYAKFPLKSEKEKEDIDKLAAAHNLSASEYMRKCTLGQGDLPKDRHAMRMVHFDTLTTDLYRLINHHIGSRDPDVSEIETFKLLAMCHDILHHLEYIRSKMEQSAS